MARCIDLFIDAAEPVEAGDTTVEVAAGLAGLAGLAAELRALTGLRLTEDPRTGGWAAEVDGARVDLAEHDLADRRLALSGYRYVLFARVASADAQTSPEAALLRRVLAVVKADGRYRAMLVWDLQNVIHVGGSWGGRPGAAPAGPAGLTSAG